MIIFYIQSHIDLFLNPLHQLRFRAISQVFLPSSINYHVEAKANQDLAISITVLFIIVISRNEGKYETYTLTIGCNDERSKTIRSY